MKNEAVIQNNWRNKVVITPNIFEYLILVVFDSKSFFLLTLWVILEGWVSKNWHFQTVVLEKTCKSPLDSKEIKPVDLKRNKLWIFVERSHAEAPILWPYDAKNLTLGKTEGRRRRGWQRMRWLDDITDSVDMGLSKFQVIAKEREAWHAAVHGVTKSWTTAI